MFILAVSDLTWSEPTNQAAVKQKRLLSFLLMLGGFAIKLISLVMDFGFVSRSASEKWKTTESRNSGDQTKIQIVSQYA